ncbi:hypothetical protein V1511DRAFT_525599 [Dipodascopsis uninucleata]
MSLQRNKENIFEVVDDVVQSNGGSRPIRSSIEALSLICHAIMIINGFSFTGVEDVNTESAIMPEFSVSQTYFTYQYKYPKTGEKQAIFLLSIAKLGTKATIYGMPKANEDVSYSFDVRISDVIAQDASFPLSEISSSLIVSDQALDTFSKLFQQNIIDAMVPAIRSQLSPTEVEEDSHGNLRPPPYAETMDPYYSGTPSNTTRETIGGRGSGNIPMPRIDPVPGVIPRDINPIPSNPSPLGGPPGFEDEYEILRGHRGLNTGIGPDRSPFTIGDDDRLPPGGANPTISPFFPGYGRSHNGMIPTADHPLFSNAGRARNPLQGPGGLHPPGARWDDPFDPTGGDSALDGLGGRNRGNRNFFNGPGRNGNGGAGGGFGGFGGFGGDII